MVHDDPPAGEVPAVPTEASDRAVVAEDVAAAYIADAVRGIPGIAALHGSHWKALSGRMRADSPTKGVVVRSVAPSVIEIDVHVKVGWGVIIPDLAREVEDVLARKMRGLLDLDVRTTTLYVDEVDAPPEPAPPEPA